MKKEFISTALAAIIGIFCLGSIVYAQVAVKNNGTQQSTAGAINFDNRAGINWSSDGFNLNIHGVNWSDLHVLATTYGDHSGINWQAIPGS